jgi:type VI secretion system secreted protein Hcp
MPIYMKYEGIIGSVKGKHAGWIELESCQLGRSYSSSGAKSGADTTQISEITVTKRRDATSVSLFREAVSGLGRKVIIDFVNNDGIAYMTISLENALVGGFTVSGSARDEPIESISLNFTKISSSTKPAAADAGLQGAKAAWNNAAP